MKTKSFNHQWRFYRIFVIIACLFFSFCNSNLYTSQSTNDPWDEVLQTSGMAREKTIMAFMNSINYRQYDVNRFLSNQENYDNNLFYWLAIETYGAGHLRESEALLDSILNSDVTMNKRSTAYELQGMVKFFLKKPEEAAQAYEQALASGNKKVYPMLAFSYLLANKDTDIQRILPELIKVKNDDYNALEVLIAYSAKKRDIPLFKKIIEGLDDSRLATKETILHNTIGMLRLSAEAADIERANILKKKLDEIHGIRKREEPEKEPRGIIVDFPLN